MSQGKVLFQLSGSIACFKACEVLSRLVQKNFEVEVVATPAALQFIGEATLEGLVGRKIHTDTFSSEGAMAHIRLARWADVMVLCPATANTLNKFSAGLGDDLVSMLFLAHDFKKPYLIASAMNDKMLAHPATQASLNRLRSWGIDVLESAVGPLACGETGRGRLLEPAEILTSIEAALPSIGVQNNEEKIEKKSGKKILVTSGGTREPIDGVRSITNFSSGRTGAEIAQSLAKAGHEITLLRAKDAVKPISQDGVFLQEREYVTFSELQSSLQSELGQTDFDYVIHAAAVSDFAVDSITNENNDRKDPVGLRSGKLESTDGLVLHLRRNPKLIDNLRSYSRNRNLKVIAFKLTNTPDTTERTRAVQLLADKSKPDLIVHNDLSEVNPQKEQHQATIYCGKTRSELTKVQSRAELARALTALINETQDML